MKETFNKSLVLEKALLFGIVNFLIRKLLANKIQDNPIDYRKGIIESSCYSLTYFVARYIDFYIHPPVRKAIKPSPTSNKYSKSSNPTDDSYSLDDIQEIVEETNEIIGDYNDTQIKNKKQPIHLKLVWDLK